MGENTKVKGNSAEAEALAYFKRNGYSVSLPFGDNDPYDLIVESPERRLYRIQVRWLKWSNGVAPMSLRRTGPKKWSTLDMSRIEAFVGWDGARIFVVPTSVIGSRGSSFSLREELPRNAQKAKVNLCKDFEGACHLLP